MKNPAAGGGRWVEVPPERLVTWVVTFAERHGGAVTGQPLTTGESGVAVTFTVTFTGAVIVTAAEPEAVGVAVVVAVTVTVGGLGTDGGAR